MLRKHTRLGRMGTGTGLCPAFAGRLRFGVTEAGRRRRTRQHEDEGNEQAVERKTDHRRGSGGDENDGISAAAGPARES